MIIKNIDFVDFSNSFEKMGRKDQFSFEGQRALFNYLEQLSEDGGVDLQLDVIALCCDYTEYDHLDDIKEQYQGIKTIEDLENKTTVIQIPDTNRIIIQNY